jgi:hypothetical protein
MPAPRVTNTFNLAHVEYYSGVRIEYGVPHTILAVYRCNKKRASSTAARSASNHTRLQKSTYGIHRLHTLEQYYQHYTQSKQYKILEAQKCIPKALATTHTRAAPIKVFDSKPRRLAKPQKQRNQKEHTDNKLSPTTPHLAGSHP